MFTDKSRERFFVIDRTEAKIIDGDGRTLKDKNGKYLRVSSHNFIKSFFNADLGVLPNAVKWVSSGHPPYVLYERHPEYRSIGEFQIPLPWMCFLVCPQELVHNNNGREYSVVLRARNEQTFSMSDELFVPPLPGVDEEGVLNNFSDAIPSPLGESIEEFIENAFSAMIEMPIESSLIPEPWDIDVENVLEHWSTLSFEEVVGEFSFKVASESPSLEMFLDKYEEFQETSASSLNVNFERLESMVTTLVYQLENQSKVRYNEVL